MLLVNIDLDFISKFIFIILFFIIFNQICLKNKIFLSNTAISNHKHFISSKNLIPISGGFFLLFSNMILQKDFFLDRYNYFYFSIFCIGIYADFSKNFKPILRILTQILIVGILLNIFNILIKDVKIPIFNYFLNIDFLALIFTVFCVLVLINGANLIDGVNLSAIGYFLLILFIIYTLSIKNNFYIDLEFIKIQIYLLIVIIIFNFFNRSYLGDSGIYLISLITSVLIIKFINNNPVSPYFAVLLVWYPCFENLFSITRRLLSRRSTSEPDNRHLHHYIYSFLNKKKIDYPNNITGTVILLFNTIIFFFGYKFYNKTLSLILIIFLAVFLYLLIYFILIKKIKI